jgi:hypothetical protein
MWIHNLSRTIRRKEVLILGVIATFIIWSYGALRISYTNTSLYIVVQECTYVVLQYYCT